MAFRVVMAVSFYGLIILNAFKSRTPHDILLYSGLIAAGLAALLAVSRIRKGELRLSRLQNLHPPTLRSLGVAILFLGGMCLGGIVLYSTGVLLTDIALSLYTTATVTKTRAIITFTSITFFAGSGLFYFRLRYRALYGLTEAIVGLTAAARFASTMDPRTRDAGFYLATLTAGVYLVVRGLDNIHHGLTVQSSDRLVTRLLEQQRKAKVAKEMTGQQFLIAFRERCASTIRPALQRIGEHLQSKGIKTRIEQWEERLAPDGRQESLEKISLILVMNDWDGIPFDMPNLSLCPDKYKEAVRLHKSTIIPSRSGGYSGPIGSVKLDEITEEFLEHKVLALVQQIIS
jgi:hypothetical protein